MNSTAQVTLEDAARRINAIVADDEFTRGILLMLKTQENIETFMGFLDFAENVGDEVTPSLAAGVATAIRDRSEGEA